MAGVDSRPAHIRESRKGRCRLNVETIDSISTASIPRYRWKQVVGTRSWLKRYPPYRSVGSIRSDAAPGPQGTSDRRRADGIFAMEPRAGGRYSPHLPRAGGRLCATARFGRGFRRGQLPIPAFYRMISAAICRASRPKPCAKTSCCQRLQQVATRYDRDPCADCPCSG